MGTPTPASSLGSHTTSTSSTTSIMSVFNSNIALLLLTTLLLAGINHTQATEEQQGQMQGLGQQADQMTNDFKNAVSNTYDDAKTTLDKGMNKISNAYDSLFSNANGANGASLLVIGFLGVLVLSRN